MQSPGYQPLSESQYLRVELKVVSGVPYFSSSMTKPRVLLQQDLDDKQIPLEASQANEVLDALCSAYNNGLSPFAKMLPLIVLFATNVTVILWIAHTLVYKAEFLNPGLLIMSVVNLIVIFGAEHIGKSHRAKGFGQVDKTMEELNAKWARVRFTRCTAPVGMEVPFGELLPEGHCSFGPKTSTVDVIDISAVP
eukprot:TRINITY_DN47053_c0_g1_i1.p1 TRINITY_DN47053_c0_g1~~TRINITY_DN47053_c0_g1_i1.p1  ORF type:complete len:194 (+),score=25.22 TRINITY_DN47053_c0_g1_i1:56-637(+)